MSKIDLNNQSDMTVLIWELKTLSTNIWWNYICNTLWELKEKCDKQLHENRKDSYSDDLLKECIDMIDNFTSIPEKWIESLRNQIQIIISNKDTDDLVKKYWQE